jgi:hypothetical protein
VHIGKISRITYISQGLSAESGWRACVDPLKSSALRWIPGLRPRRFSAPSSTGAS